jgi:pimeloyl-ACP methyl ester carboxylesterase
VNSEKIRRGLWSATGGAIVLAIVGFSWGGWVTGGTAQQTAEKMAADAVTDRLASICAAQFNQDSEKDQKLKKLEETNTWERDDYVEKQGWATMPGEKEADSKVAGKCAKLLV